jgi:hypothetical protein
MASFVINNQRCANSPTKAPEKITASDELAAGQRIMPIRYRPLPLPSFGGLLFFGGLEGLLEL